ncbi:protein TBATA isoform X4 [Struthio camelus]|uniref:protein TBATA isoform X4 n=1 Tax=Struthio camelus TaxID=8801 RepID=UPI003603CAAB
MKGQLSASIPGAPGRQMPIGDPPSKAIPWLTTGALSEAWREELRELTARVEAFSPAETAKEEAATQEKAQRPQRVTQHSAETGRLIPPPSRATARHSSRQLHRKSAKTEGKQAALSCQDQELAVLELLCQILQTYSLMAVQQWLLTAGPRGEDNQEYEGWRPGEGHCRGLVADYNCHPPAGAAGPEHGHGGQRGVPGIPEHSGHLLRGPAQREEPARQILPATEARTSSTGRETRIPPGPFVPGGEAKAAKPYQLMVSQSCGRNRYHISHCT